MKKVTIEISSCMQCPFFKAGTDYSLDGWDRGYDWMCKASNDKIIAGFVEKKSEEEAIRIPDWCPAQKETAE